ncbi:MAG TPA: hypothetical protein VF691_03755 [Cytophagaceae bacterium]|jgi:hypothetical protein
MRNFNENERELVKLVHYFRKRAEKLIEMGKLSPDHRQVGEACEKLISKLEIHATQRAEITNRREQLKTIIKDNAKCPKCQKNSHLKFIGLDTHEKGWKSNKYKCRRCNIQFTWNRPNNPWDMITYIEGLKEDFVNAMPDEAADNEKWKESQFALQQLEENLQKLRPVIEGADQEYADLQSQEEEMARTMKEFKRYLLMEKVKLDTMD